MRPQVYAIELILQKEKVLHDARASGLAAKVSMKANLRFVRDESGATAIEYGLIAAGISVAIIATVQALGTNLNTTFTSVSTALK